LIEVGPGDDVIVPTFTMIAVANAVDFVKARPVFADNDPINR
jgi:perosamine synthetase